MFAVGEAGASKMRGSVRISGCSLAAPKCCRLRSMFSLAVLAWIAGFCGSSLSGCSSDQPPNENDRVLRLATTTSTVESGLLAELLPVFEAEHDIDVTVLALGTGAALQSARDGKADVVLVHAKEAEDAFVAEGYGINRQSVMYNEFVILGPPSDPAGIGGSYDALASLKQIHRKKALFLSRGDHSGTHMRELLLWEKAELTQHGDWLQETGQGMLETLRRASDQRAYVLSDRSTYLFNQQDLNLRICVEGDKRLFNPYSVIPLNPARVSGVNFQAAMEFVDFLSSSRARDIIASYGRDRFGDSLFTPLTPTE